MVGKQISVRQGKGSLCGALAVSAALLLGCGGGTDPAVSPLADPVGKALVSAPVVATPAPCALSPDSAACRIPAVGNLASMIPMAPSAVTITPAQFFNWAGLQYPSYFRGAYVEGAVVSGGRSYTYRYFAATDTYLALSEGAVFVLASWTGGILNVGTLTGFTCAVQPSACGGTDTSALAQATAFVRSYDEYLSDRAGSGTLPFLDACYLDEGMSKNYLAANLTQETTPRIAFRIGSRRTNIKLVSDTTLTNADGSKRREVKVTYDVSFKDGSTLLAVASTIISGSSQGSCATPESYDGFRFFGDRQLVGVGARSKNIRTDRYSILTGLPDATPLSYRREANFRVYDPSGNATYVIVSGPGPSTTIAGRATPFSIKMVSPRVMRSAEMARAPGNFSNWTDEDIFRMCRAPTALVGSGVPVAAVADCVTSGVQGSTWGTTLNNPTAANVAASDLLFSNQGWTAGGSYTFSVYNDDGWKTVNGQAGKTPIAVYTDVMTRLPYTFAAMLGSGVNSDNFPRITASTPTPVQLSLIFNGGVAGTLSPSRVGPTPPDGRVFAASSAWEYFEGPSVTGALSDAANRRFITFGYPSSNMFAATVPITARPEGDAEGIWRKSNAEFTWEYTDRTNSFISHIFNFR